jgi:predicted amidohydrolase YtcJ
MADRLLADLIVAGDLVTMDPDQPRAEALATLAGTIVAVGSHEDVTRAVAGGTPRATIDGTIIPGLIDSHLHLQWSGLKLLRLAGPEPLSATEALEVLNSEPF